jgi:hypothetical protein
MKYFKYIFSDRKTFVYWTMLFIILFIYSWISIVTNYETRKPDWIGPLDFIHPFLVITVFLGFYSAGYLNLKRQEWFLKKYSNLVDSNSIKEIEIILFQASYTLKPLRHNYDAKINPKPKTDKFKIFQVENNIGLLGQTYDFGVFKRHIKPIIISLNGNVNLRQFEFAITPRISSINHLENDIEITFESSVFGINKIKLNNWKQKTNSL